MNSSPAIEARSVHRRFGAVTAVNDFSLTVPTGEILALLGPNGAGKTTFLDMVLGFSAPSDGSLSVLGMNPGQAVRAGRVGAVMQTGGLLDDLTVAETVRMIAACHRRHIAPEAAMERAGITRIAQRKVKKCSGGEQQRLRFALALLTDPELIILDEPTAGMDVSARHEFWAAMHAEADRGRTIVFATHFLPEAEDFADRIVLMRHGALHSQGTPSELTAAGTVTISGRWASAEAPHTVLAPLGLPDDAVRLTSGSSSSQTSGTGTPETRVQIVLERTGTHAPDDVARHLLQARLIEDLRISESRLDDVFLALTTEPEA
ncbi:MAG: ABC transporter ATP-binding protein [Micrococcus sp.]|nr:ABC transporter ATP-binding protein [Micrococcus sp.]